MDVHQVVPIVVSLVIAEWIQVADSEPADQCADASDSMDPWST